MKKVMITLVLMGVAGCGADGDPVAPKTRPAVNVGIGSNGVNVGTSVNTQMGGINIGLGKSFGL